MPSPPPSADFEVVSTYHPGRQALWSPGPTVRKNRSQDRIHANLRGGILQVDVKRWNTGAALAFLLSAVTACASTSPVHDASSPRITKSPAISPKESRNSKVSGTTLMVGGPWPDRRIRPKKSMLFIQDSTGRVVAQKPVISGKFTLFLPRGDYRVSAKLGDIECGPPQRVSTPSSRNIVLNFICPIR